MPRPSGKQLNDVKIFCRGYVACLENQIDVMNGIWLDELEDYDEWVEWDDSYTVNVLFDKEENRFNCRLHKNSSEGLIEDSFMEIDCYEKD